MDAREKAIRQRLKDDFPHYAARCLRIRTKAGSIEPLTLNAPQRYLHERIEAQRARTGAVRQLVVKGRQQGCSTYVEGRFFWKVTHLFGVRAFILAHDQTGSDTIFEMVDRYYEHCPEMVRPSMDASNAKELDFGRLDSGYRVATAGSKGAGRSQTVQYFHGSEVAYWPNAERHLAGALQAVPPATGEIVLESTSAGPQGVFYELCKKALAGRGEYELTFIPWFWSPEYRIAPPDGFTLTEDEATYAATHGLDLQQMVWRRAKIDELNGVGVFRAEYPATVEEAFTADAAGALWRREEIEKYRVMDAPDLVRVVVAIDPQATKDAKNAATGIIAGGLGANGHAYVLEDGSINGQPPEWAQAAIDLFKKLRADKIIGERNNGGDMVGFTLKALDPKVPVELVWASRGKEVRAGPVTAKYRAGQVHHVGYLTALEDEQCTWVPGRSDWSPNRLDADVWLLTELFNLQDEVPPPSGTRPLAVNLSRRFGN
ncbi:MAG: phage terminase large subunit family protein [Armatimonadota bacterium]